MLMDTRFINMMSFPRKSVTQEFFAGWKHKYFKEESQAILGHINLSTVEQLRLTV